MKPFRLRWWPALALLVCVAGAAPSQASTRNYLTVEGKVSDHLGSPLPGTWVFCLGSRRASAPADSLGNYRLEIPGATLEELERTTLKIRIQARRKGYRFALANGAPELGLEMRVVKDDTPLSRLRVRSNDSTTVAAVANSIVLDANPRALLGATFVGSPGAQYDTPPVPLDHSDEITLAGRSQSIPELAADAQGLAPASTPASTPEPARNTDPNSPAAVPGPPGVPVPAIVTAAPTTTAKPPASTPAETEAPTAPRKWNAAGSDRDGGKPRVVRPALGPSGAETAGERPPSRKPGAADAPSPAPPATDAAPRTTTRPSEDPNLRPVLRRDLPMSAVGSAPQPPVQSVPTAPGTSPPARPPIAGPATPVPVCDCTIRGTVEVQWDRPLTSRTEVVIAIEDAPDATTSAELFMGSPRAFEIHPAPCGVHRLLLWTRSRQRFVLASSEPRVVCTPGGMQQMRLVLEPVARWGAP